MAQEQKKEEINELKKARWNAALHITNQIGELSALSSANILNFDFVGGFFAMKEVRKKISSYMNFKEVIAFANAEGLLLTRLTWLNDELEEEQPELHSKLMRNVSILLDEYCDSVMMCVTLYGFGTGIARDRTKMGA